MKTTYIMTFVAAFLLILFGNLIGQQESVVAPSDRVRVSAPTFSTKRLIGTVIALKTDTLEIKVKSGATYLQIPFSSVKKLEVSRGSGSRGAGTLKGAGLGFLIGAAGGALVGYIADEEGNDLPPEHAALIGAGFFATIGIVVGGITGAVRSSERWEQVSLKE